MPVFDGTHDDSADDGDSAQCEVDNSHAADELEDEGLAGAAEAFAAGDGMDQHAADIVGGLKAQVAAKLGEGWEDDLEFILPGEGEEGVSGELDGSTGRPGKPLRCSANGTWNTLHCAAWAPSVRLASWFVSAWGGVAV